MIHLYYYHVKYLHKKKKKKIKENTSFVLAEEMKEMETIEEQVKDPLDSLLGTFQHGFNNLSISIKKQQVQEKEEEEEQEVIVAVNKEEDKEEDKKEDKDKNIEDKDKNLDKNIVDLYQRYINKYLPNLNNNKTNKNLLDQCRNDNLLINIIQTIDNNLIDQHVIGNNILENLSLITTSINLLGLAIPIDINEQTLQQNSGSIYLILLKLLLEKHLYRFILKSLMKQMNMTNLFKHLIQFINQQQIDQFVELTDLNTIYQLYPQLCLTFWYNHQQSLQQSLPAYNFHHILRYLLFDYHPIHHQLEEVVNDDDEEDEKEHHNLEVIAIQQKNDNPKKYKRSSAYINQDEEMFNYLT